jgi:hypothetical protein
MRVHNERKRMTAQPPLASDPSAWTPCQSPRGGRQPRGFSPTPAWGQPPPSPYLSSPRNPRRGLPRRWPADPAG